MSASNLKFFRGESSFQHFQPDAANVFGLTTQYDPSDPLWHYIEYYQGIQYGNPIQWFYILQNQDPVDTLNALEASMASEWYGAYTNASSQPNIITLAESCTFLNVPCHGHAVIPYEIIDQTSPTGDRTADIYIYDNNFPGDMSSGTMIPQVIHVDVTQDTFSTSYNGPSSSNVPTYGGSWGLGVISSDWNDQPISLPLYGGLGLTVAVASGPASLLNTDSQGRSEGFQNGQLVEQIPGARRIVPLMDSSGSTDFPEAYRFSGGQYVTTLSGNDSGSATATLFNPSTMLAFTSPNMTAATVDTIALSQDGSTVVLSTNVSNEQSSATLTTNDQGSSARDYTVTNTSMAAGETITLTILNGGSSFQVRNTGESKTYDLLLDQVGAGAGNTSYTGLSIGAGEIDTFTPSDWTNLGTGPVTLQIQNSQGTTSGTLQAPAITSASGASFTYGAGGSFVVTSIGFPKPTLVEAGALPGGASFSPSTGVLTLLPTSGPAGVYNITFVAMNAVGTSATQSFTLTVNQATPVLAWTPASLQLGYPLGAAQLDATASVPGTFTYTPPAATAIMTTSQTLSVLFSPTDTTDYTTARMSVSLTVTPGPLASVSPASIDFGTVYLGTITGKSVTVTNQGTAPMMVTDHFISILSGGDSNEFVAVNLCPKSLAAGKSCTIVVSFVAGPFYTPQTATLRIVDNAPGNPQTASLTATVIDPQVSFNPTSVSFGAQTVDAKATKTVTLTNRGATTLSLTGLTVMGTNASDFTAGWNCGSSLLAGNSCTISVTFEPAAKGPASATLQVTDNAQSGTQTVPLSGTGR